MYRHQVIYDVSHNIAKVELGLGLGLGLGLLRAGT